jgi:hypothetical protein
MNKFVLGLITLSVSVASGCAKSDPADAQFDITREFHKLELESERRAEYREEVAHIMLALKPEIKSRLHLHLLDFEKPDMNVKEMAKADAVAGNFNILTGGFSRFYGEPAEKLRTKYGIEVIGLVGCQGGKAIFRFMDDYNSVSEKAIENKFGAGFLSGFGFRNDAEEGSDGKPIQK